MVHNFELKHIQDILFYKSCKDKTKQNSLEIIIERESNVQLMNFEVHMCTFCAFRDSVSLLPFLIDKKERERGVNDDFKSCYSYLFKLVLQFCLILINIHQSNGLLLKFYKLN